MPKSYEFYGGQGQSQEALAQAFAESARGAQFAAGLKVQGYTQGANSFQQGLAHGLELALRVREEEKERKFRGKLAAEQRALEELLAGRQERGAADRALAQILEGRRSQESAQRFDAAIESERARRAAAEIEQRRRLELTGLAGEQGYDVLETGQRFGLTPELTPPPVAPGPGNDPRQFILKPEPPQEPQGFAGITRRVPPPPVEQQRFDREKQIDAETMQAIALATQFAGSKQGRDTLYMPVKRTRMQAMKLDRLPPDAQEAKILELFPSYAPSILPGMDGKEDRSKLDKLIKWLEREDEYDVPSEAGMLQGRNFLARSLQSEESLKAAMEAIAPETNFRPARTMNDAARVVDEYLLNEMEQIKRASMPAQLQGGGDLLQALREGAQMEQVAAATGEPQGAMFSPEFAGRVGIDLTQSRELQSAAAGNFPIAWNGSKVIFLPTADGTTVHPATQAALDALPAQVKKKMEAAMAVGATQKQSPSELETGAAARKATKKQPAPTPKPGQSEPGQGEQGAQGQAPTQRKSAIEAWQELKKKRSKQPATPPQAPNRFKKPRSFSTLGEDMLQPLYPLTGRSGLEQLLGRLVGRP